MSHSGRSVRLLILTVAGALAAVAFAVRGVLDWDRGGGQLLLVAAAVVAALLLRHFAYRD